MPLMGRPNRRQNKKLKKALLARAVGAGRTADDSLDAQSEKSVRQSMQDAESRVRESDEGLHSNPVGDDAAVGVGGLFRDPSLLRHDASLVRRFVAERISCGAVDEDTAKAFIRRMYAMAGKAKKPRDLSSLANALNAFSKSELEYLKFLGHGPAAIRPGPSIRAPQRIGVARDDDDNVIDGTATEVLPIGFTEDPSDEDLDATLLVAEQYSITELLRPAEDGAE